MMKWRCKSLVVMLLMLGMPALTVCAQHSDDDVRKEINRIKKSSAYIYSEVTDTEADVALQYAESALYENINKWVAGQKKMKGENIVVNNRKELWTTLSMARGSNMYRAFVYVKKSDILTVNNTTTIEMQDVAAKTPDAETSVKIEFPDIVLQLAEIKEYASFVQRIKELQKEGKIDRCDRYLQLKNPEDFFLAIYDRQGTIVAVLSPGAERCNVATGNLDSEKNYKGGFGALGFNLK